MHSIKPTSKPFLLLLRLSRRLWVRVALMAFLAILASVSAMLLDDLIPTFLRERFTPDAVMPVLTILASGMLAVSTFSLNVMVTAHNAAASQATPRAHRILLADTTTQTVLATFIGAFVYALSAIILFKAKLHAPGASVVVMGYTVVVLVLVILAILRWIDHLSDLGSMDATLRAAEAEARSSLLQTRKFPAFGAIPLTSDTVIPTGATPLCAPCSGYLQFIDVHQADKTLKSTGAYAYITLAPGRFVLEGQQLGHVSGLPEGKLESIRNCLTFGQHRTFEQDAGFGLLVLSEIASRALSPGINDPGTAIDVIARQEKLLWEWAHTSPPEEPPQFANIFLPELTASDLIENAFSSTARDGASVIEVGCRLQHALHSLSQCSISGMADATEKMSSYALAHADTALLTSADKNRLQKAAAPDGGFSPSL